jgi:hypothetical protein
MGKKKDIISIDISKKILKEKQKLPSSVHALKNRQITQDTLLYDMLLPDHPNTREEDRPYYTTAITNAISY